MDENLELVQNFIFDDNVQTILSGINNNLMDFNILEITGMGTQEIKHSNILGWLFDNSEHNLGHQILDDFLRKIIQENPEIDAIEGLQSYLYLAQSKKNITIYREKDNIDLLIIDESNKVLFVFENKLYASEREDGETDDGQLSKYENIINTKYISKEEDSEIGYDKYFIFLTKNLEEAQKGEEMWLRAQHQNITDVLVDLLKGKKDLSIKTRIIFESYIDLLKRSGIVPDKVLKKLCKEIWDKKEYREALEIILNNRPSKFDNILKYINTYKKVEMAKVKIRGSTNNIFVSFDNNSKLIYNFMYRTHGVNKGLGFVVVSDFEDIDYKALSVNGKELIVTSNYKNQNAQKTYGYFQVSRYLDEYKKYLIQDENINKEKIHEVLDYFLENDRQYLD